jgi:hypothetical protein
MEEDGDETAHALVLVALVGDNDSTRRLATPPTVTRNWTPGLATLRLIVGKSEQYPSLKVGLFYNSCPT